MSDANGKENKSQLFLICGMDNKRYVCKNIGFPKNEGYTRNFLGRGNAAAQAMNFIVMKFEQAKRALTM